MATYEEWPVSDDGYNCTVWSECGHDPIRLNIQPGPYGATWPVVGWYGMCWCDEERERKATNVTYDACLVVHIFTRANPNIGTRIDPEVVALDLAELGTTSSETLAGFARTAQAIRDATDANGGQL